MGRLLKELQRIPSGRESCQIYSKCENQNDVDVVQVVSKKIKRLTLLFSKDKYCHRPILQTYTGFKLLVRRKFAGNLNCKELKIHQIVSP